MQNDHNASLAAVAKARSASDSAAASHVAPEITIVELDPAIWHRGNAQDSFLLRHNIEARSQCCLGIACSQLGVSDNDISGKCCLRDVYTLPAVLQMPSDIAGRLYGINDSRDGYANDAGRVAALNSTLIQQRIPLRFRLKGTTPASSREEVGTEQGLLATAASEAQKNATPNAEGNS